MTISIASEEGRQIIDDSQASLKGQKGSILSFVALSRLLHEENSARLAEMVEILTSKDIRILKQVFYYEDEAYGAVQVSDDNIKSYLTLGQFYHPITKLSIELDNLEERILIEFEVL